jgi:hypothetical protein
LSEVDVAAGISIHPSWSSYSLAQTWVQAYSSNEVSYLYNFGNTSGYPAIPAGTPTPEVPPPWDYSSWTTQQLYNVSTGITGTLAFPLVFQPQHARNWYAVKRWSLDSELPLLDFAGVMSECGTECDEEEPEVFFSAQHAGEVAWLQVNGDPDEEMQQELEQNSYVVCSNDESVSEDCEP